ELTENTGDLSAEHPTERIYDMRIDRPESSAALLYVRPPAPRQIRVTAMGCLKYVFCVMYLAYLTHLQHRTGGLAAVLKTEFVVDQSKNEHGMRGLGHFAGFGAVHGHRLFAENVFFVLQRKYRHFTLQNRPRGNTYGIDFVVP